MASNRFDAISSDGLSEISDSESLSESMDFGLSSETRRAIKNYKYDDDESLEKFNSRAPRFIGVKTGEDLVDKIIISRSGKLVPYRHFPNPRNANSRDISRKDLVLTAAGYEPIRIGIWNDKFQMQDGARCRASRKASLNKMRKCFGTISLDRHFHFFLKCILFCGFSTEDFVSIMRIRDLYARNRYKAYRTHILRMTFSLPEKVRQQASELKFYSPRSARQ
jgi:hypothetical protein